eukprot:CAMPEP_0113644594 /NCGR_PEP_ID=MMETSP0017_2-20120614/23472_1 /TAXON_ID=2856 /ORGANISM="Cylindrotheca closterium" /LENGTH=231 /DNA_ID=CAMNT_0000556217 /DNA_START=15 /DNA_END=710 /DNA_ORIENTATION=- /assembly_acc=CAM_ASM_000147
MKPFITLLCLLLLATVFPSSAKKVKEGSVGVREECPCELAPRPDIAEKALTARWMVHSLDWGILATISTRLGGDTSPIPFGNVYSFVDGTCEKSTGTPYFYGTYMDQSYTDSLTHETVSLTLSEASLSSVCTERDAFTSCTLGTKYGDPENPVCARLTLTGKFIALTEGTEEYNFAKEAIFERHPTMEDWPDNHEWVIAKIDIEDVWLIDFFGGASILTPEEYFAAMGDGR